MTLHVGKQNLTAIFDVKNKCDMCGNGLAAH